LDCPDEPGLRRFRRQKDVVWPGLGPACLAYCPKEISADWIARMNRDNAVSAAKKM